LFPMAITITSIVRTTIFPIARKSNPWKIWGKLHRKTGPAVRKVSDVVKVGNFDVGGSETLEYWENGKRHRIDGPAVISDSGVEYWLYNRQTTEEEVMKLVKSKSGERGLRDFLAKIKAAVRPRQAPKVEEI